MQPKLVSGKVSGVRWSEFQQRRDPGPYIPTKQGCQSVRGAMRSAAIAGIYIHWGHVPSICCLVWSDVDYNEYVKEVVLRELNEFTAKRDPSNA